MKIARYQHTNPTLAKLLQHSQTLRGLQAVVDSIQTPGRVQILNLRNGRLILATTQAAVATRLRFSAEQIREQINQQLQELGHPLVISAVTIRLIAPTTPESKPRSPKPQPISPAAARSLAAIGDVTEDKRLKKALTRLSQCAQTGA